MTFSAANRIPKKTITSVEIINWLLLTFEFQTSGVFKSIFCAKRYSEMIEFLID